MSSIRVLGAVMLLGGTGSAFVACSTDAIGVEDCREIERARCDAAVACGLDVETEEEVASCKQFAHDNCLHGLPGEDAPAAKDLNRCVKNIEAAGACAADENKGPDSLATECGEIEGNQPPPRRLTVCEAVQNPEELPDCHFLLEEPPEPEPPPDAGPDAAPDAPATDATPS